MKPMMSAALRSFQLARSVLTNDTEAPCLASIPKLGPVTAAVFLGAIGDPRAYEAGRQILRVAGLSLVGAARPRTPSAP